MRTILLACNAGMSTSLLVQKMQREAQAQGLDVQIKANPLNKALEMVDQADCLLLGPQIAYAQKEAVKAAGDTPVFVIAMADYGRMNAKKILDDAMKLMGE
ncbi:PTS system cellobiose-specific IIB component [Olsenella profusa DSM 13989]|uniref:PTS system, lactose/cellobiose-specific IIB subunit n=1 Tax=Olsenella profusa F0195 TaxID=1125712 RepID=U2TBZ6_9ACTN|nr:PTS sugar transporter subunit IIB [Olsenella profusa]ERL10574.1 PTS system, lactose/cellobiose-specific IIB subunit [Olsenella profusa F0195]MDP9858837.1 PTS system cellobiose-specific IIB component [Olsenella profusa DSM 13989]